MEIARNQYDEYEYYNKNNSNEKYKMQNRKTIALLTDTAKYNEWIDETQPKSKGKFIPKIDIPEEEIKSGIISDKTRETIVKNSYIHNKNILNKAIENGGYVEGEKNSLNTYKGQQLSELENSLQSAEYIMKHENMNIEETQREVVEVKMSKNPKFENVEQENTIHTTTEPQQELDDLWDNIGNIDIPDDIFDQDDLEPPYNEETPAEPPYNEETPVEPTFPNNNEEPEKEIFDLSVTQINYTELNKLGNEEKLEALNKLLEEEHQTEKENYINEYYQMLMEGEEESAVSMFVTKKEYETHMPENAQKEIQKTLNNDISKWYYEQDYKIRTLKENINTTKSKMTK